MVRQKDKWLEIFMARGSLATAKFLGSSHARNVALRGEGIVSERDLQRVQAYNMIKDLNPKDIGPDNVDLIARNIKWAEWIPMFQYPRGKDSKIYHKDPYYICNRCHGDVPVYTAVFPDGSKEDSLTVHRRSCLKY